MTMEKFIGKGVAGDRALQEWQQTIGAVGDLICSQEDHPSTCTSKSPRGT